MMSNRKGLMMMERFKSLSDDALVTAFCTAVVRNLEQEFIDMLYKEICLRGISYGAVKECGSDSRFPPSVQDK
ncbi:sporulation histidine kinase inhibitor Sda [Paenibacillus chartarius]|uniref:Sporulation histidine kinase inhibitor Sda n=1 Tax=Paenibacillus chartarius TaxID=747481 RepID=A0ABV6DLY9_9BACL